MNQLAHVCFLKKYPEIAKSRDTVRRYYGESLQLFYFQPPSA